MPAGDLVVGLRNKTEREREEENTAKQRVATRVEWQQAGMQGRDTENSDGFLLTGRFATEHTRWCLATPLLPQVRQAQQG